MKPNIQYIDKKSRRGSLDRDSRGAQSFPKTDYSFQAASLSNIGGRCLGLRRPSFRMISQGYFENEARVEFVTEAALFSVIVATVAVPLFHSASALLQLVRSVAAF
ncbi:MAG: hypothetical protein ABJB09_00785 [Verrucomicrobiota bacterium]